MGCRMFMGWRRVGGRGDGDVVEEGDGLEEEAELNQSDG